MVTSHDLIQQAAQYGVVIDDNMVRRLAHYLEKTVGDFITEYAVTMFRVMNESALFPSPDPGFMKAVFLRWVMGGLPDRHFMTTPLDEAACQQRLSEVYEQWGVAGVSLQTLQSRLQHVQLNVAGHIFKASDVGGLNHILGVLGSRYRLATKPYRKWRAFIWGMATEKKMGPFHVMTMVSEHVRTPNLSLDNPAFTLDDVIVIRREVCEQVVAYKWLPLCDDEPIYMPDRVSEVSVAIRRRALGYGQQGVTVASEAPTWVTQSLEDNVLYHECGHRLLYDRGGTPEMVAIAVGLKTVGVTAFDGVLEWLADMAPRCEMGWGGLHHVATLPNPAYRLASFYGYLSDVYFFDTQARPFYFYSAMIVTVMVRMMSPDGSVDFDRLRALTDASSDGFASGIYQVMLALLGEYMTLVKGVLQSATYIIEGREYGFSYLEAHEKKQLTQVSNRIGFDSYHFLQPAWANYLSYFKAFSPQYDQLVPLVERGEYAIRLALATWADMGLDPTSNGSYQDSLITHLSHHMSAPMGGI